MKKPIYVTIEPWQSELFAHLKQEIPDAIKMPIDLNVYALVYSLSRGAGRRCMLSSVMMAEFFGVNRQTTDRSLARLIEIGLLQRNTEKKIYAQGHPETHNSHIAIVPHNFVKERPP